MMTLSSSMAVTRPCVKPVVRPTFETVSPISREPLATPAKDPRPRRSFGVVWNGGIDSRERTVDEVGPEFFQGHKPIERSNGVCRLSAAIECSRMQDSISLSACVFIGQDVVVRENAGGVA